MSRLLNILPMNKAEFPILASKGLFPIESDGKYIIYAPLCDVCFGIDSPQLEKLERIVREDAFDSYPDYLFIKELIIESREHKFREHTPSGLTGLSIFPTWNCNFNCSYCYAANSHKRKSIPKAVAARAVDFFFANMGNGEIALQILGGGEPFTEWALLIDIARLAREAESRYGRKLTMSVATNGSILNDEIIRDICELDLRLSFSFDILEDIQAAQRSSYKKVSDNLKRLLDAGLGDRIFIRTVITKRSVNLIREMAEEVLDKYHGVCGVIAEPVMGMENFDSIEDYAEFCEKFYTNFREAREFSRSCNLNFTTMALRNVDYTINYGCEGDFCITPDGEISICHRLASPTNEGTDKRDVYGDVSADTVSVDADKYSLLLGSSVDNKPECVGCFARYNCGGGCIARNLNETVESKSVYCRLFRKLIKDEIILRYKELSL